MDAGIGKGYAPIAVATLAADTAAVRIVKA
jgi:hypothetical protein